MKFINAFKVQTNCYINSELKQLALTNNLNLSKLLEFGIKFKLSELDLYDIPSNYLLIKINKLQEIIKEQDEARSKTLSDMRQDTAQEE